MGQIINGKDVRTKVNGMLIHNEVESSIKFGLEDKPTIIVQSLVSEIDSIDFIERHLNELSLVEVVNIRNKEIYFSMEAKMVSVEIKKRIEDSCTLRIEFK